MAYAISNLPTTQDALDDCKLEDIVQTVRALTDPNVVIEGNAPFQVNSFLAYAAVRMAGVLFDEHNQGAVISGQRLQIGRA